MSTADPGGHDAIVSTSRSHLGLLVAVTVPLASLAGAVGCILPWEMFEVTVQTEISVRPVNGLHGVGIVGCAGAVAALLCVADLWWRGGNSRARWTASTSSAALMLAGALLFLTPLGSPLARGEDYAVRLGPGLPLTAASGLILLACSAVEARHGAWRQRG